MSALPQTYLGDGAYAEFQGYCVRVFTSNGIVEENSVTLEPEMLQALIRFVSAHGWNIQK